MGRIRAVVPPLHGDQEHLAFFNSLAELVNELSGFSGNSRDRAVRFRDLDRLGLGARDSGVILDEQQQELATKYVARSSS